jgi:uncharacterized protein (TIGR00297 family)
MGSKEMLGNEADKGWAKAIPQARDRSQSRVLAWIVVPLLLWMTVDAVRAAGTFAVRYPAFVLEASVLSVAFALAVIRLKASTPAGAMCGGMICWLITFWTGIHGASVVRSGPTPLVLLFVLTFLATRAGKARNTEARLAEGRRPRSASQVIANLSVAAICASPISGWLLGRQTLQLLAHGSVCMLAMCLAALVEATADTVSSEVGQAFGGTPVIITTLRRVNPGTDGAVTLLGSLAGVLGGLVVALLGGWALHLGSRAMMAALAAGVGGLVFDSLLGATVERRGWMGNDLVNFTSTAFAVFVAYLWFAL